MSRGRYAPSPTGELHLGNASTALVSWWAARSCGSSYVMRVEDLDRARERPGARGRILDDLRWLGIDWDEGPDVGGPHAPYLQSRRAERYREAFDRLAAAGRLYPCFCSRRDIAAAASAPQEPGDEVRYPGTCRDLDPRAAADRVAEGRRHSWRFRVEAPHAPRFDDAVHGRQGGPGAPPPGDFVVLRSDGAFAYQLAVVVDDAHMGIEQVVRGDDLLPSTARQLLLIEALDYVRPAYAHVPLVVGADGARLSKRHEGTSIAEWRAAGRRPAQLVGALARALGLAGASTADLDARALVERFAWGPVAARGGGGRTVRVPRA